MSADARLILASASPRRSSLLREAGFTPIIHPADIDESQYPPNLTPIELAKFLAVAKAEAVAPLYPSDITLAADTIVLADQHVLGKPRDTVHARQMLTMLSGSLHQVISGVAIVCPTRKLRNCIAVTSIVQMRRFSPDEMTDYVASNRWEGKAGGYGIQDNDPFITRMSGSLTNIVGLPMDEITDLLRQAGISRAQNLRAGGTMDRA